MHTQVEQKDLLHALKQNMAVKPKNNLIPALEGVLIELKPDKMQLTTNNLNTWIHTVVPCKTEEEATLLVHGNDFTRAVEFMGEEMELTYNESMVEVTDGKSKVDLPLMDKIDYPICDINKKIDLIKLPAKKLAETIKLASAGINPRDSRQYLTGLNIRTTDDGRLNFIGSNGSLITTAYEMMTEPICGSVLIPYTPINELISVINSVKDEEVFFGMSEGTVSVQADGVSIFTKTMDLKYPDILSVIRDDDDMQEVIELSSNYNLALDKISLIDSSRTNAVNLVAKDGELYFHAQLGIKCVKAFIQEELADFDIMLDIDYIKKAFKGVAGDVTLLTSDYAKEGKAGYVVKLNGYRSTAFLMSMFTPEKKEVE